MLLLSPCCLVQASRYQSVDPAPIHAPPSLNSLPNSSLTARNINCTFKVRSGGGSGGDSASLSPRHSWVQQHAVPSQKSAPAGIRRRPVRNQWRRWRPGSLVPVAVEASRRPCKHSTLLDKHPKHPSQALPLESLCLSGADKNLVTATTFRETPSAPKPKATKEPSRGGWSVLHLTESLSVRWGRAGRNRMYWLYSVYNMPVIATVSNMLHAPV